MLISKTDRILGGLWGSVVGDALGLPVQFRSRDQVRRMNINGMIGNGTFDLPAGSWSDDSSLMICTVESLLEGFDTRDLGQLFIKWLNEGYWTPWGQAYDIGNATIEGISRMKLGVDPEQAGGADEQSNGNGSLMRILPVALYFANHPGKEFLDAVHRVSCLTHAHPRSQMACGFFCLMAIELLQGAEKTEAYLDAVKKAKEHHNMKPFRSELHHFHRVLSESIDTMKAFEIRSSGYVMDTLEASLWCLLTNNS